MVAKYISYKQSYSAMLAAGLTLPVARSSTGKAKLKFKSRMNVRVTGLHGMIYMLF